MSKVSNVTVTCGSNGIVEEITLDGHRYLWAHNTRTDEEQRFPVEKLGEAITFAGIQPHEAKVGRHKGLVLMFDVAEGYHASNGADSFGYHDNIDDLKAEIDDYWSGTEHGPLNGFFTGEGA